MKITKRPKKITLTKLAIKSYTYVYTCPSCYTKHSGLFINEQTIRFCCYSCGQELIIEKIVTKKEESNASE